MAADKAACPHGTCPHGWGGLRRETVPAVNFHGLWRFSKSKEAIGSTAASRPRAPRTKRCRILCATLLTPERVTVHNIPQILDVMQLIELLRRMGVEVEQLAEDAYSLLRPRHRLRLPPARTTTASAAPACAARSCSSAPCWRASAWDTSPSPAATRSAAAGSTPISSGSRSSARSSTSTSPTSSSWSRAGSCKEPTCCWTKHR